uniref:AlNc14C3G476 protein n=1 Tax=Albugo laibachii Nc14 TaxID=890382 RepID=F0VZZ8_9STRA|nr:AlNc14C3G476 [Albugo laibachii Nc14]|eukprot:CCA14369.1 AlNc14C3G476 [Albugo laibachii Nc14]
MERYRLALTNVWGSISPILESSHGTKDDSFLGSCCQLGIRPGGDHGHEETTRNDIGEHDNGNVGV